MTTARRPSPEWSAISSSGARSMRTTQVTTASQMPTSITTCSQCGGVSARPKQPQLPIGASARRAATTNMPKAM